MADIVRDPRLDPNREIKSIYSDKYLLIKYALKLSCY